MPVTPRNILLGWFFASAAAGTGSAWSADKTFDQHFDALPGSQLTLDTDSGSVSVTGHDSQELSVHADMAGGNADGIEIQAHQNGSSIKVTGRGSGSRIAGLRVRFTIEVPRDCTLDLRTSGGGVEVRGVNAAVRASSAGGPMSARDVTGAVALRTSGGTIAVTHVTGNLDVDSSGGSIDLGDIDGAIKAQTAGGGVQIDARANRGMSVMTSGGSIELRLPGDTRATVDASTTGGRIRMQLPMTKTEVSESARLRGEVNGGGDPIVLHTAGGGIEIGSR